MKPRSLRLVTGLCLLVAAPLHATDFVLCNKGAVTGWAALAHRNGTGLFTVVHAWQLTGWFKVEPNQCETLVSGNDGEPIYLAISFTDADGDWGAFVPDRSDGENEVFHYTRDNCVDRKEFDYTRGGSDPNGPCKTGYFPFPITVYITPTSSRGTNTYSFSIDKDDLVTPIRIPEGAGVR